MVMEAYPMKAIRQIIVITALCYVLLLGVSWIAFKVTGQRGGTPGLVQIFAPYLFLPVLLMLPFAFVEGTARLSRVLLLCTVLYGCRFVSGTVSLPHRETPGATQMQVMTWNVLWSNENTNSIVQNIRNVGVDVVALQELTVDQQTAIERKPYIRQHYPYRRTIDTFGSTGIGLLSRYPIVDSGIQETPPLIWARLNIGSGQSVMVVTAHPVLNNPRLEHFDPIYRDMQFDVMRTVVEPMLLRNEAVIVAGDFNVTEREPGYHQLTAGLLDTHLSTGNGLGNTWRPRQFLKVPLGLLRIDYLLGSPRARPLRSRVDCTNLDSDHCMVLGTFELLPAEPVAHSSSRFLR